MNSKSLDINIIVLRVLSQIIEHWETYMPEAKAIAWEDG